MTQHNTFSRRTLLRSAGAGVVAAGTSAFLASCGIKGSSGGSGGGSDTLTIGFVSPQTGQLASFAQTDRYVVGQVREAVSKGIKAGGKTRRIRIVVKDSQSSATRAAQVARELVDSDHADIIVSSGTPDTSNPVADQCEASGVPNVTTFTPWEPWFFGRNGEEGKGFQYSTIFFFGMQENADCILPMWDRMDTSSKNVGCLYPDDTDANAFRDGLMPLIDAGGYHAVDGGKYDDGATDFSAQISTFKKADAQLFTSTPIPPDFQTYWKQAVQQGYKPKLATIVKSMMFPAEAESLGDLAKNISTSVAWSPAFPYKSSLTGVSASDFADDLAATTGVQWTQALGPSYTLFEVAVQALKNSSDPSDRDDVAQQLHDLKIETMCGALDFTSGPQPGIAIMPPVGGQWRPGEKFPWDVTIVDNAANPAVNVTGDLEPTF